MYNSPERNSRTSFHTYVLYVSALLKSSALLKLSHGGLATFDDVCVCVVATSDGQCRRCQRSLTIIHHMAHSGQVTACRNFVGVV